MSHETNAVAATLPPDSGWVLHSGGRQFGPLSDDELRQFFRSGVVKQGDTLSHPGLGLNESAVDAALRLQVPVPVAAHAAAPLPPPVRHLAVQRVEGSGMRTLVLALIMLALAAVFWKMPGASLRGLLSGTAGNPWVTEANRLEDANQWPAARAHAERWLVSEPSASAWLYEGRALLNLQRPAEAERAFRNGLELSPKDAVLLANLGALYYLQGQHVRAAAALQAAIAIDPSQPGTWYTLGQAYSGQALDAQALSAFQKAAQLDPGESGAWTEIGYTLYRLGRMNEAVAPLEKAIALESGYARPRQILEAVRDALAGRQSQVTISAVAPTLPAATASAPVESAPAAAAAPAQAVAADATASQGSAWDYWQSEATKLEDKQDWTALRNFGERWTQEQAQRARAWSTLGTAQRNLRQWDAAIQANRRAAELAPDDTAVLARLALSYSTNLDYVSAIPVYEHLLRLDPGDNRSWNNLGAAYHGVGRLSDAVSAYQKAVSLDRGNIIAWNNLGRMYYESNHFPEAIDAYQTALSMAPENEEAKVGLQRAKQR